MARKKVLITGSPKRVESLAKCFATSSDVEQVTLADLDPGSAPIDYYVQLGVLVPARGDTVVRRVQSFLNDGLLERFALAEQVLPLLAADAVMLLVAGNTTTEVAAPDDHSARLALLRVLAHAVRADSASSRIRVRVITSERTDDEIAEFALTGAKDPDVGTSQLTQHPGAPEENYPDWRIQIMGLAQIEM
jgi:hypothetical protein